MAIVYPPALVQHVLGLGGAWVRCRRAVRVNIAAHAREEVGAAARGPDGGPEPGEISSVGRELVAEEGEVVLLERGRGKTGFGVEEPA